MFILIGLGELCHYVNDDVTGDMLKSWMHMLGKKSI